MNPFTTVPYFMPDEVADPKAENRCKPNVDFPISELSTISVLCFKVDRENWAAQLDKFGHANDMKSKDDVYISREHMENFDAKMEEFFTEHLHDDHEVRYIGGGSGYFDFRNKHDKWIRIPVTKGDLLFLPAGIYHRFAPDHNEYTYAIRLFKDEDVKWDAIPRSEAADALEVRQNFLKENGLLRPAVNNAGH